MCLFNTPWCIIFILFAFWSCSNKDEDCPNSTPLEFDQARFAIFPLDSLEDWQTPLSKNTFKQCALKQGDFLIIDELFKQSVDKYNQSFEGEPRIDVTKINYRLQLVGAINSDGEREVWVNCFCNDSPEWKNEIVFVFDGGPCFFNVRINLSKNTYSHFVVNGVT